MKELSKDLLTGYLDELAAFETNGNPFVILYLNAQADRHRRDNFEPFVRKELARRAKTFAEGSSELYDSRWILKSSQFLIIRF